MTASQRKPAEILMDPSVISLSLRESSNLAKAFQTQIDNLLKKIERIIANIENKEATDLSQKEEIEKVFSDQTLFDTLNSYLMASKNKILEASTEETDQIETQLHDLKTKLETLTELLKIKATDLNEPNLFVTALKNIHLIRHHLDEISKLYYSPPTLAAVGASTVVAEKKSFEEKKPSQLSLFWSTRKKPGSPLSPEESKHLVENFVAQIIQLHNVMKSIITDTTNPFSKYRKYNSTTKSPNPMTLDMTNLLHHLQELGNPRLKQTFANTMQAYESAIQNKQFMGTPEHILTVNAHLNLFQDSARYLKNLYSMEIMHGHNKQLFTGKDTEVSEDIYQIIQGIVTRLEKFQVPVTTQPSLALGIQKSFAG